MPRITISYRREDSGAITGRIFDRLVARYGRESIFRDIDNIPLGVDFRQHIGDALGASNIVLAIVGPRWTGARETGNRLDDEADPVRLEIEATLRKGVPLIPVLVLGATMPQTRDLPDSLKDFAFRNAIQIDAGQDFDVHIARLIRAMDEMLNLPVKTADIDDKPKPPAQGRGFQTGVMVRLAVALAIVTAVGISAAGWYFRTRPVTAPPETRVTAKTEAPPAASAPQASPAKPPAPPPVDAETVFWQSIAASKNAADFDEYISKYPNGRFVGLARNRLAALAPAEPPAAPGPVAQPSFDCAKAQSTEEIVICSRADLAAADGELGKLYWSLYNTAGGADAARLKADETAWVQTRNADCSPANRGASVDRAAIGDCLLRAINNRIAYLRGQSTAVPAAAAPLASGNATICGRPVNYTVSNSTSPQYTAYLGVWMGVWNNASRICGAVIVEEVNPGGVADVTYIYGPSNPANPFPWREQRVIGRFDGTSRFSFEDDEGGRFAFSLTGDRTLDAVFSGQSGNLHAQFAKLN